MRITIQTIPHNQQRYETCGDWLLDIDDGIIISVSQTDNWKYNFLVGLHEMIEAALCNHRGVSERLITAFDKDFEAKREVGNEDEPGDDPGAPYKKEHFFATSIERLVAAELGVDWKDYEDTLYSL